MKITLKIDSEISIPPLYYGGIEHIIDLSITEKRHKVYLYGKTLSYCPMCQSRKHAVIATQTIISKVIPTNDLAYQYR